jgi:hypothetical protein
MADVEVKVKVNADGLPVTDEAITVPLPVKASGLEGRERTADDAQNRETMKDPLVTMQRIENEPSKGATEPNESEEKATEHAGVGNSEETGVNNPALEVEGSREDNQRRDETRVLVADGSVEIDEKNLLSETKLSSPPANLITDLDGFEEVCELGSSRFGTVRLLRRPTFDGNFVFFAAKFYNVGDNNEGRQVFDDRMKKLLELSHPHVMQIVGVIPPTRTCGPILLTPYSSIGSLETVLSAVRSNKPPPIWTDATKLRLIVSLVSGLNYLHKKGIVHRELKPNDLIVDSDGSLRICGYATSIFEEHKYTTASQFGDPSYAAPEVYDDELEGKKTRDPKTDVFSFGLIVFEILCGQKVFSPTMSAAAIMRKAQSDRPKDRPMISSRLHKVLQEMICRSWVSAATKRQPMETHWKRMRDVGFKLLPGVEVKFLPHTP